jgi:hypothetical protein
MGYTGNFDRVTLVGNDRNRGGPALRVDGTSHEAQDARAISVAMPHNGVLLMAPVDDPAGSAQWSATFPQQDPPIGLHEELIVIGIAMLISTNQPFVWAEQHKVSSEEALHG